jgi:hypothetical protein
VPLTQPIVDDTDIQVHLPVDKFLVSDYPNDLVKTKLDVSRVIFGRLSGTFSPATLASWSDPTSTPETIRAIGGRLGAALMYRNRLAEDYPEDADYAQLKYREAMMMLEMIVTGEMTLPEVTEEVNTGMRLTEGNFVALPDPKFTMDMEF